MELLKYPRTQHLESSGLQKDDIAEVFPYADLAGRYIVVEEKYDGANCGISFNAGAELLLQSRGHYLDGGGRETQFSLFKRWAVAHEAALLDAMEDRYVVYAEYARAVHSIFYDDLPHYVLEFDVFDRRNGEFLSTPSRRDLLQGVPIVPVTVLYAGPAPRRLGDLLALAGRSTAKTSNWRAAHAKACGEAGIAPVERLEATGDSDLMEGLYIKIEEDARTVGRLKWVRPKFVQNILDNDEHWSRRPLVWNQLAQDVDIFSHVVDAVNRVNTVNMENNKLAARP